MPEEEEVNAYPADNRLSAGQAFAWGTKVVPAIL